MCIHFSSLQLMQQFESYSSAVVKLDALLWYPLESVPVIQTALQSFDLCSVVACNWHFHLSFLPEVYILGWEVSVSSLDNCWMLESLVFVQSGLMPILVKCCAVPNVLNWCMRLSQACAHGCACITCGGKRYLKGSCHRGTRQVQFQSGYESGLNKSDKRTSGKLTRFILRLCFIVKDGWMRRQTCRQVVCSVWQTGSVISSQLGDGWRSPAFLPCQRGKNSMQSFL